MIVAEIGQNFIGDMELAKHLIRLAYENGADLAKFQLYNHQRLYGGTDIADVELSKEDAFELFKFGEETGIEVFFSIFDLARFKWCEKMGVRRYKIPSSQNQNMPLIEAVMETEKETMISARSWDEAGVTINRKLLYCIPDYPVSPSSLKFSDINFTVLFDGYSDHTIGLQACMVAISMGAKIIEKHFAIDHHTGVDALWSMTPDELRQLRNFYDRATKML